MGCASSSDKSAYEPTSYGAVAGRPKQFIEGVNPNFGAPTLDDSPKHARVAQPSGSVRRALLVGCDYPGNQYCLHGCVRDIRHIQQLLQQNYQFEDIQLIADDGSTTSAPTGAVIKDALAKILQSGQTGDSLVFYFSGHGTQGVDPNSKDPYQAGVEDEAIVPTDFNLIYNEDLRDIVNQYLQPGAKFTMIADSCHSGNLLEQESPAHARRQVRQVGGRYIPVDAVLQSLADQHGFNPMTNSLAGHLVNIFKESASNHSKRHYTNHAYEVSAHTGAPGEDLRIILLSGCRVNETSEELPGPDGQTDGALTSAILQAVGSRPSTPTYREVLQEVMSIIADRNIVQHPTLEVNSDADANSKFLLPDNLSGPDRARSEVEAYVAKGVPPVGFSVVPKGYDAVSYGLPED